MARSSSPLGVLLFFINVWKSRSSGAPAGDNPWDGHRSNGRPVRRRRRTISRSSRRSRSRHPLWEDRLQESDKRSNLLEGLILDDEKEAIATSGLDAEPQRILKMPEDTLVPFFLAVALLLLFTGLLLQVTWLTILASAVIAVDLIMWFWPRLKLLEREPANG